MAVAVPVGDLCSVEDARMWSLRDASDTEFDALFALLIPGASEACSRWANRQFVAEDDVERMFPLPPCGSAVVAFSPYELRAPVDVQVDGVVSAYGLWPLGGTQEGTYRAMTVELPGSVLTVGGDWGMATVPPLARMACLVTVDAYYQNAAAHTSESLGSHSYGETFGPGGLPEAARFLLERFRGVSIG